MRFHTASLHALTARREKPRGLDPDGTRSGKASTPTAPSMPRSFIAVLVVCLAAAFPVDAETKKWTVDDLLLTERASQWNLDPEGRRAVWVRSTVTKAKGEEKRVSNLWMSRLDAEDADEDVSRQLTRGSDSDTRPRFSPDGRHVAFLSTRDLPAGGEKSDGDEKAKPQVWLLPLAGGEPRPATRFDRPVRDFDWIDDETLAVMAQESPTAWEKTKKEKKDTSVVVDDAEHEPPVRLFRVKLAGEVKRLTENDDWLDRLDVAPGGRHAVVSAQQSLTFEFDSKVPPHTYLVDLESGERTRLFEDGVILPEAVFWQLDGSGFFVVNLHTRHPVYRNAGRLELYRYELERRTAEKVDLDWERGLGRSVAPTPDGFLALLADGVRHRAARYVESGDGAWQRQDLEGEHADNLYTLVAARDGSRVVYETSSIAHSEQPYTARLDGVRLADERQLAKLSERHEGKPTGKFEVIHWQGARGETVEGILQYPLDWREGQRRPLVLDVHGGPWGLDMDRWSSSWASPNLLWRQRGAFVFQVNYHGSAGYGLDWSESIAEHYYELEIPDIETGVDHLIERGLVDPERLASTGWSNGGILTAELITRTGRYKAAVVGAADVEWASDWANVDFGASFDNYYFGTTPWEDPQLYVDKSPFFRLEQVTTPTIVHTGTEDRNVPPHQSWSLFRALQYMEKTPVRLVLYPGEPHELRKIAHQRRKVEEDLAWLDRYLFATAEPENEAIQEGSLLEALLERSRAARAGRAFGRESDGVLVPETVAHEGLEVGRFEVTRAQYAAFDEGYEPVPGEENLPATGLGFEQARAYAEWLASVTGRPFRLPTVEEAKRLAKSAGSGGNTLDRWAGYTPNPDDAERLAEALAELEGTPLLLPVGRLPGDGDDPLFDLDGNAAEWAVGDDGEGVATGPSADRSTDPRSPVPASPEYTGWRVVVGD